MTTSSRPAAHIDSRVMECYFREHMAELGLLFHDLVPPNLATYDATASEAPQLDFLTRLPAAPSRLLRLTADSPDLVAIIKQEGYV